MSTTATRPDMAVIHNADLAVRAWPENGEYRVATEPPLSFVDAERIGLIEGGVWLPEVEWTNEEEDAVPALAFTGPAADAYLEEYSAAPKPVNDMQVCIRLAKTIFEALTDTDKKG